MKGNTMWYKAYGGINDLCYAWVGAGGFVLVSVYMLDGLANWDNLWGFLLGMTIGHVILGTSKLIRGEHK